MLLLIDENVPDLVTALYRERGHTILLVRDRFPPRTPDHIITDLADELRAVIVTWNHKHFRALISRKAPGGLYRYARLGLISYEIPEPQGVLRTRDYIDLIEHEHRHCHGRDNRRVVIHIGRTFCRLGR